MRAVLLFARHPEAERRAKNLQPAAAAVFQSILNSWRDAANQTESRLIIAWRQCGNSFGERLANSVEDAFRAGATSLLVAGIDTPPPAAAEIRKAFDDLESGRVRAVVGPAHDGGICLIGLTSPEGQLLRFIRPRQSDVMDLCRQYFGGEIAVLPTASDFDSNTDLAHLGREPLWSPYRALLRAARTVPWIETAPPQWISVLLPRSLSSRAPPFAPV